MSGVNEFLAQYYNTVPQESSQEDLHKQAQIELFQKLASDSGIDLESLSDEQVQGLWGEFQGLQKSAEEEEEGEKKDDKKEEAKKEHEEKKAQAAVLEEKLAEADFLGRTMAHAYVDELKKIADGSMTGKVVKDIAKGVSEGGRAASSYVKDKAKSLSDKAKDVLTAKEFRTGKRMRAIGKNEQFGKHLAANTRSSDNPLNTARSGMEIMQSEGRKKMLSGGAKTVGAYGAGALAAGAGGKALVGKKKESSAIDELAGELAVVKAASAGWDVDQAAELVAEVLYSAPESEKIASVADVDTAIEVRSLELLEYAGYPVTWQ